ncbi:unnamed protein product [Nyctereutes procyonoides]|uniref:(raccoon dog) hypothetical protein n=1 Tax=Nyctereutes procyonoides TaxID=34880 RepID=A0A811YPF3_NYCPR|nr:unnamed protein product [Nyctereutes procyonoides]
MRRGREDAEDAEDAEGGLAGTQATPSCSLQRRQSLPDMPLVKLQLCHMLVEPNLCRSVLMANTVRQVQEEVTQAGPWRVVAPRAAGRAPRDRRVSAEVLCGSGREQEGERPAPDLGDGRTPGLAPGCPQSSLREVDSSRENPGGFQKSLDQIFGALESKTPGSAFTSAATPPRGSSCRSDLGELDHAVGILVEAGEGPCAPMGHFTDGMGS